MPYTVITHVQHCRPSNPTGGSSSSRRMRRAYAQRLAIYRRERAAVPRRAPAPKPRVASLWRWSCSSSAFAIRGCSSIVRAQGRFWNGVRRMSFDTRRLDPLRFLLENVPVGLCRDTRDKKTGNYHLRAGVILSALGWNMGTKDGAPTARGYTRACQITTRLAARSTGAWRVAPS